jgi:hypothetical protein
MSVLFMPKRTTQPIRPPPIAQHRWFVAILSPCFEHALTAFTSGLRSIFVLLDIVAHQLYFRHISL